MIFIALAEAAEKGELILAYGGMCRWHRRKDGIVTIREILVLPSHRGMGLGRSMVDTVRFLNPGLTIQATCPVEYPSNEFWRHLGFTPARSTEASNLWQLPASSGAPTATLPTAESPLPPDGCTE